MNTIIKDKYEEWLYNAFNDKDVVDELMAMKGNDEAIEDAFYKDLEFGTAGLRGVIGAGTNRMNIYTVARASQGLANYVNNISDDSAKIIAISYDSRIKSKRFAQTAAAVFAANDIMAKIYPEIMPVPCLSYAVRRLHCSAGIMITASHNPAEYNGYKVYDSNGCQITSQVADAILAEIEKIDIFSDVKNSNFDDEINNGNIAYIENDIYDSFVKEVKMQSVIPGGINMKRNLSIVYSPLNGTGLKPVMRVLVEMGYTNITVVKEQQNPDGNFTTCPYPNPEMKEAMSLGIEYAKKINADLLIATDPDCDRVGIAVKNKHGDYQLLTGNETGILLFEFICKLRTENKTMPNNPVAIKTIVTTSLIEKIAQKYGVKVINVLTGFKYIGEQIGILEKNGIESSYIFGFEESYGYLSGAYVRDKDAVAATLLICEMFAYYASIGMSLTEHLNLIYNEYGYHIDRVKSYSFEGIKGFKKMKTIMENLRSGYKTIGDFTVTNCIDFSVGINGLPKADVVKFELSNNCSIIIRPSGTEPKIKAYISADADTKENTEILAESILSVLNDIIK